MAKFKRQIFPNQREEKILRETYHVSHETIELFQIYADLLVEWQTKTNLVSNNTIDELWTRHILDSAQCKSVTDDNRKWLDLGSGAGFPALVISILSRNEPDFSIDLVESNQKKCAFLRKVIRETGIKARVHPERIESVSKQYAETQIVSARALAALDQLLEWTFGWISNGATGLFPKGKDYAQELEKCRGRWNFDLLVHRSQVEQDSVILEVRNLTKS